MTMGFLRDIRGYRLHYIGVLLCLGASNRVPHLRSLPYTSFYPWLSARRSVASFSNLKFYKHPLSYTSSANRFGVIMCAKIPPIEPHRVYSSYKPHKPVAAKLRLSRQAANTELRRKSAGAELRPSVLLSLLRAWFRAMDVFTRAYRY